MWVTKKKVRLGLEFLILLMAGCSAEIGGELVGVQGRPPQSQELPPYGMVLIPQGSFNMGMNDEDIIFAMNAPINTVSVDAFWIDQTEITNNEYRQFVYYVIDSISRRLLGDQFEEFLITENALGEALDPPLVNWEPRINPSNPEYAEILNELYAPANSITGRSLKVQKLVYEYAWIDYDKSLGRRYGRDTAELIRDEYGNVDAASYIIKENTTIYPDTLVWIRDFAYAYNEPFALRYFSHPAFDDYPVVGVTWRQASAFCAWRTKLMRDYCNRIRRAVPQDYRLPTEAEWEYAARGGLEGGKYPWGGLYTYDKTGCYRANFLPQRARYGLDGGTKTLPVGSYQPNDFGLFDMAGNVSEWTGNAYDEQAYGFVSSMNPNYRYNAQKGDPLAMRRKTLKGGSWKDIAYFLQCGARTFEYQDTAKSYIGFRCVRTYVGK
ncbi:MAG: SUMF1/EgtB/PvdO family nonheme iron enzyme [Prevotellaceae bacterium]|jgi:gliding motility-associated lipoprotein GldK|nr:SUMF1/EgtB/PvdO family nonheme iron enzyme [Prevotellaceae bacterium]